MQHDVDNWMVALRVEHPKHHGKETLKLMKGNRFPTRKAARHWCKHHWNLLLHHGMVLLAPTSQGGEREEFTYHGLL